MAREKRINLFNKNHVTLTKYINTGNAENELVFRGSSWSTKKNDCGNFKWSNTEKRIDCWVNKTEYSAGTTVVVQPATKKRIVERLKSPLGFYYTKITEPQPERTEFVTTKKKIWRFYVQNNVTYELIYYTEYNGVRIGFETRPWDLMDNKYIEDHFINSLIDDLISIIADTSSREHIDEDRLNLKNGWDRDNYYSRTEGINQTRYVGDLTNVKKEIFTDLFGYPDGPKYQTNDEKILAHGFDLKTSFRKM